MRVCLDHIQENYVYTHCNFVALFIIVGITFSPWHGIQGQKVYNTDDLLSLPIEKWNAFESEYDQLSKLDGQMPLVQKMEFRTESNSSSLKEQEFLFRTSFNRKKSIRAQAEINALELVMVDQKIENQKNLILANRFDHIVDWWACDRQLSLMAQKKLLLIDKSTIYQKKLAANASLDIQDLLKITEEIGELNRAIAVVELEKSILIRQLIGSSEFSNEGILLDTNDWVTLDVVFTLVEELVGGVPPENIFIENKTKIDLAKVELDKKQYDANRIFDFAQVKYSQRNNRDFENEWSMGVGLTIPFKSYVDYRKYGAQIELAKEQYKLHEKQLLIEQELELALTAFQRMSMEYGFLNKSNQNQQLMTTFEKFLSYSDMDPLVLIQIKELELNSMHDLSVLEENLIHCYLDIVQLNGRIGLDIECNFLSNASVLEYVTILRSKEMEQ